MIKTFSSKYEEDLFKGGIGHKDWANYRRVARRKLLMVHAATILSDFKNPPNNKLEELKKERKGQHAIRINQQYRVCFTWRDGHAYDVEITDYHDD